MKIKNKIVLVVNPISGSFDKTALIKRIENGCAKNDFLMEVFYTTGEDDQIKITEFLEEIRPKKVLVLGGDGTIQLVANAIESQDISLGIIPAGSANGLALNLEIPENRDEQIAVALGNSYLYMDILKINGETCLHIADFGINAELIQNYENSQIRGKLGYFLQTIPTLLKCEYPFKFEVEANGEKVEKEGVLLAIANANKFGTGANINPQGKMNDGNMEVLIFKNLDFIEIFKTLQDEVELNPEFVEVITTKQAKIKCQGKVAFQIDGEFMGHVTNAVAEVSQKKLKVAVPTEFLDRIQ